MIVKRIALAVSVALVPMGATADHAGLPQATDHWFQDAQARLQRALDNRPITGKAKNVILFIGDGNGVSSVTATRIFAGQNAGGYGEENMLAYEEFPALALSKTYNTNAQVADSAGTAAAMVTGVKTKAGVLSVDEDLARGDCENVMAHSVPTIAEMAHDAGMATGVVSTARLTHATPGAVYAHAGDRNWEAATPCDLPDIAIQAIESDLDLAMGGGRRNFIPKGAQDEEGKGSKRADDRNLVEEWTATGGQYAWDDKTHAALRIGGGRILGLFESSHMKYEADRVGEPSLAEMTRTAIQHLSRVGGDDGYFLMVEAGRIDHANHDGNAYRTLHDGVAFSDAVAMADALTHDSDTLIVVTADHSHVLVLGGYAARGTPILGLSRKIDNTTNGPSEELNLAKDGKPYTTLGYYNGSGSVLKEDAKWGGERGALTEEMVTDPDYVQEALIPLSSETHAGEDVAIYAKGPQAHLFQGTVEQNYIFHVMHHALWGVE